MSVQTREGPVVGEAVGIDDRGALLLQLPHRHIRASTRVTSRCSPDGEKAGTSPGGGFPLGVDNRLALSPGIEHGASQF